MISGWIIVSAVIILCLLASIKILREYERGVVFRWGRVLPQAKVFTELSWDFPYSVNMGSKDSVRLEHQYLKAQTTFEQAQRDLDAKMGILPRGEFLELSQAADQAWLTVQRTRAAVDRHMREHSCRTTAA
jgi:aminoglycoside phosphotransferase